MLPFIISPQDIGKQIGGRAKALRIQRQLTQQVLARRVGVSTKTVAKFENYGKIDLQLLIKIAAVLGALPNFEQLFNLSDVEHATTLDELLPKTIARKRAFSPRLKRTKPFPKK